MTKMLNVYLCCLVVFGLVACGKNSSSIAPHSTNSSASYSSTTDLKTQLVNAENDLSKAGLTFNLSTSEILNCKGSSLDDCKTMANALNGFISAARLYFGPDETTSEKSLKRITFAEQCLSHIQRGIDGFPYNVTCK